MENTRKPPQKVLDFLKHHSHAILSTVSENGKPWGSSIYVATDDELNFYFITRVNTHKYKNITGNPNVSLTISDNDSQTTVQAAGKITKVPTKDIVSVVMKKLAHIKPKGNSRWVPPIVKVYGGDYTVLKLTPSVMNYADYQQVKSDIHDNFIEKII